MRRRHTPTAALALLVLLLGVVPPSFGARTTKVETASSAAERRYSFEGSFSAQTDPDHLLEILYAYRHLTGFVRGADSITLMTEGADWYEVEYRYSGFFYSLTSVYRKTVDRRARRIEFRMVSHRQKGHLLPTLLSSSGSWSLEEKGDGWWTVRYRQDGEVDQGLFSGVLIGKLRREAVSFMEDLRAYVERSCP